MLIVVKRSPSLNYIVDKEKTFKIFLEWENGKKNVVMKTREINYKIKQSKMHNFAGAPPIISWVKYSEHAASSASNLFFTDEDITVLQD